MASRGPRRRPPRRPGTLVRGEAAETDSELSASSSEEEELYLGPSGPTRGRPTGLRVAGEAAETDSDPEPEPTAAPRDLPPLVVQRETAGAAAGEAWGAEEAPAPAPARSLLQLRLAESQARLDHDVAAAVSGVYRRAGRDVAALAGRLAAAQAAGLAAAHSVRLARGDLCALAERLDIVASCCLLPDIRGVPGTEPEQDPGPRA
ncbi:biogenesis of lysosome-related organelles complex 1 subunit 3 [Pipistrellus kuhlii]|uniref:biogenesis of lysosome-related organelles complex 1 subunit 3 n=1 Tax=Pipistrellus kuhlii TaxID=59472 RepID=UPI00174EF88C|nr:biogenesis of lysosome-related organelles complex 1 subunit 3 [Pipistrellus kuhlii]XP_036295326.1 biogenesis of lysosome-related organelles complex 1 subunit 3 [Pipistrellus kuhlii]XP_045438200.1 biogenesis of lysosome-related organelles complex 1 subunit 3 [Pipistrellus kuhlii]